jgi:hypothetical protein
VQQCFDILAVSSMHSIGCRSTTSPKKRQQHVREEHVHCAGGGTDVNVDRRRSSVDNAISPRRTV